MEENRYNSLLYGFLRNPAPTILWFESFINNRKICSLPLLLDKEETKSKTSDGCWLCYSFYYSLEV